MPYLRYAPFVITLLLLFASISLWSHSLWWLLASLSLAALSILGISDLTQTRSALRRNYPIVAHIRYLFEYLRPMLRQYIVEDDDEEVPFSFEQRSLVYQRAK